MSGPFTRTIASAIYRRLEHGQKHEPQSSQAQEHAEDRKEVAATLAPESKTAASRHPGAAELVRMTLTFAASIGVQ